MSAVGTAAVFDRRQFPPQPEVPRIDAASRVMWTVDRSTGDDVSCPIRSNQPSVASSPSQVRLAK